MAQVLIIAAKWALVLTLTAGVIVATNIAARMIAYWLVPDQMPNEFIKGIVFCVWLLTLTVYVLFWMTLNTTKNGRKFLQWVT